MIPESHPDKRPLDERLAERQRVRAEAAVRWDPRVLMDHPEAGGLPDWETDDVSGRYADRLRVFWGALALALTAWGCGRPSRDVKDDDVRYALEYATRALSYRGPSVRWLAAIDALQDAHADRFKRVHDIAELPLARPAMADVLAMRSSRPLSPEDLGKLPNDVLRELFSARNLLAVAREAATRRGRGERLRLFWASVWLALAAWGVAPADWVEQPVRTRSRVAIQHAADAVSTRTGAGLTVAEAEVRAALEQARAARSTTEPS